ncbi:unnamed protein product [Leuciscus chuanchicus]
MSPLKAKPKEDISAHKIQESFHTNRQTGIRRLVSSILEPGCLAGKTLPKHDDQRLEAAAPLARQQLKQSTGESPLTASNLMVAVDQVVVNDSVRTFAEALVDTFMTYYILNIDYPVELGATMEFLQRCMFKINPDKGSKVQKQAKKKCLAVNPKVLSLISKISEHDWME